MADSWQKYLYKNHQAFAVGPFTSESSVQLLDVLTKTNGSKPILYKVGSMVDLGFVGTNESQTTVEVFRQVLKDLESNQSNPLIKRDTPGIGIQHVVKCRASLQSSVRIFGAAAKFDLGGVKDLECNLKCFQTTGVNRAKLTEYIGCEQWKPDVDKLKKFKHWSEPSRGVFKFFSESNRDLWVIYEILEAKEVTLASVDSHSGAVGADVTTLSPVGGPPMGGNLSVLATKKTLFKFKVPGNKVRAFAFRAIHAQYDSTGKYLSIVHKERGPYAFAAISTSLAAFFTRRKLYYEIDIDPRLDLGGLFLKSPGDIQDDNEDLECLEIVVI
ncbi:unnamed protein product [Sphagnum compactum]